MKKKIISALLASAMVLSLAACSGSQPAATQAAAQAAAPAAGEAKYAVIIKTVSTSFWKSMYNGIDAYVKENNINADLFTANSDTDDAGQLAIVEQCINSGQYAGIAIAPVNSTTLVSAVKQANAAGIPVVNIDERFNVDEMKSQGAECVGFVSSDNEAIGYMGAQYISSLIPEGSKVGLIEGIAGNTSSEERASGAKKAFADSKMELAADQACDWDMQKALDAAAAWITQYPDLKAIYCCNDGMAAGVRQAVASAGADIYVCGTDGDVDAIEAVAGVAKDGVGMTATVAQDPAMIGVSCVKLLIEAVKDPAKYPASAEPAKTPVDAILVTADNAKDYL